MSERKTAYHKHWERLAQLLGEEEAAAERKRMTADERADLLHKRIQKFKKQLPGLERALKAAQAEERTHYAARLSNQITYRRRVIAQEETPQP